MPERKYAVTIYVAAPGTPLLLDGGTSLPGHMYFSTEDATGNKRSFGFAPIEHGSASGPGRRYDSDVDNYSKPVYARTMEITKDQFDRLNEFGHDAGKFGFNMQYQDVRNNCVDFTWAALNHAGIHREKHIVLPGSGGPGSEVRVRAPVDVSGKNALRPTHNIEDIQSIENPVPHSPVNTEKRNPMPKDQSPMQWLLSDKHRLDQPAHPANGMFRQAMDGVAKLNAEHGVAPSPRDSRFAGSLTVAATAEGMRGIDHVMLSDDASRAFAVEGNLQSVHGLDRKMAWVETMQALETPLDRSSAAWPQAEEQGRALVQQQEQQQQQQAQQEIARPSKAPVMSLS
ncbi:XVIPCD domain-containing protein [Luteibacter sp. 9133]|uniref:XVIPCD domain-containing protein n=1 Tax=Luteibacter sp. 9133 TaxID=1500891 RepID=UPI0005BE7419|nr:XVIPCD domain-containing protein [Luteibacter sp. 9133]